MEPPPADLQALRRIWLALVGGVALAVFSAALFLARGFHLATPWAQSLFYLNAVLNAAAVLGAFAVQERLPRRLAHVRGYAPAIRAIRQAGTLSLASLEASALLAAVVALLTGQGINLLFAVPFFAFAGLFWPTAQRVSRLLRRAGG